jgi:hypothetical protein
MVLHEMWRCIQGMMVGFTLLGPPVDAANIDFPVLTASTTLPSHLPYEHNSEPDNIEAANYIIDMVLENPPVLGILDVRGYWEGKYSQREIYEKYYEPSPEAFIGTGTRFGHLISAWSEILYYGKEVIPDQMKRGYVLVGSGDYGYHPELEDIVDDFLKERYPDKLFRNDYLLDNQNSPIYTYFADSNLDEDGWPIKLGYGDLSRQQRLLYDIAHSNRRDYFVDDQSHMTPLQAIMSGKYRGIYSGKSPNDIGREMLLYKIMGDKREFIGVAVVGGVAQRSDWTGIGAAENEVTFHNPLITRYQDGQFWAFDLDDGLYEAFGGDGGPVFDIVAIDVLYYLSVLAGKHYE